MSIRLRLAVVFAVAAAAVFALGGWLFVDGLASSLLGSIDSQLSARLPQAGGALTSTRPSGPAAPGEYVVGVVDPSGKVRGASAELGDLPLLGGGQLARARTGRILVTTQSEDERARVLAAPLAGRPGWVAVAAVSLEEYDSTVSRVTREVAVAGGVFVFVAGAGAYGLARAALSPVERLRREVAGLADRERAGSVRVPGTHDEIAALARTMNALLQRLQRAITRQRALVADASHGLRTPLAVLRGELELASRPGRSREELASAIDAATDEVTRLARITEQLLFLARTDAERLPTHRERTDVAALLGRSRDQAATRAAACGVEVRVDAPSGPVADLDPGRIREAVDNLVDNALRFAPAGTTIVLTGRADGPDLRIEVGDAGPGFPPEYLPHVFERFSRPPGGADTGAGLGLAIVAAIAEGHGGRALARNGPDGGARVVLLLPGAAVPDAVGAPDD